VGRPPFGRLAAVRSTVERLPTPPKRGGKLSTPATVMQQGESDMSFAAIILFVVLGLIVLGAIVILLLILGIYNRLVTLRNRFKNAFSQIDVQLKRRYDLIPNLVETAKGYMKHERETLEAVINARKQAAAAGAKAAQNPGDAGNIQALAGAETALTGTMSRFFALMESYPDLKANENMRVLMEELTSTENKVAFSRQAYNDAVTTYNTKRETFPAVMVAGAMGFKEAQLFEVESPAERAAPKVAFS
jgi:LemA protein